MIKFSNPNAKDPYAHLKDHIKVIKPKKFDGFWSTIELKPNIFIPQSFTIGVLVGGAAGSFSFRLLTDISKFECIYGKAQAAFFTEHLKLAESTLLRANKENTSIKEIKFESVSIAISEQHFTSGDSMAAILDRLFNEMVILEPSDEVQQTKNFLTLDTNQVRQFVNDELKKIAGTKFEKIVVDDEHLIPSEDGKSSHLLSFNLRPADKVGSVLSAVYKSASTVELNMLRAGRDLATYAKLKKIDDIALFIMTAKESQYEKGEFRRMSELVDEQSWRLENQGFRVVSFEDPAPIAKSIYEWSSV